MPQPSPVTHLFVDIGGVLLTNGWDRKLRAQVADRFALDPIEMNERHHLTYDTYEQGKLSLEDYFDRVVFWQPRSFSLATLLDYIKHQATAIPEMIDLVGRLKAVHGLRVAAVSNEAREIAIDRIERFRLDAVIDFFVVSSFVHLRKPDEDIYRLALDIAHAKPEQVVYIDDRQLFVEVAGRLGIRGIWHRDVASTARELASLGLRLPAS